MTDTVRIVSVDTGTVSIALASYTTSLQGLVDEVKAGKILWGYLLTEEKIPRIDKSEWQVGIPTNDITSIGIGIELRELEVVYEKVKLEVVKNDED
jgi:hypothetical protein